MLYRSLFSLIAAIAFISASFFSAAVSGATANSNEDDDLSDYQPMLSPRKNVSDLGDSPKRGARGHPNAAAHNQERRNAITEEIFNEQVRASSNPLFPRFAGRRHLSPLIIPPPPPPSPMSMVEEVAEESVGTSLSLATPVRVDTTKEFISNSTSPDNRYIEVEWYKTKPEAGDQIESETKQPRKRYHLANCARCARGYCTRCGHKKVLPQD